ncbi:MAG: tetratricopeptide repeat protein [Vibrio sp.]
MSDVNQALSQLAKRRQSSLQDIEPVSAPRVKQQPRWVWAVGGFLLSLAVGGWAVNSGHPVNSAATTENLRSVSDDAREPILSPTQKTTTDNTPVYSHHTAALAQVTAPQTAAAPLDNSVAMSTVSQTPSDVSPVSQPHSDSQQREHPSAPRTEMTVQQVTLTPHQLAQKAQSRAEKALDSNEFDDAISSYQEALRYTPDDANLRKALSALYYGKEDTYHAYQVLQEGINRTPQGVSLRLALARMLIQEKEMAAALTPLTFMVDEPSVGYLSLRAALANKNKRYAIALTSYQQLVQLEPNNARWWLGLGIQQERADHLDLAQHAYHQALSHVGISSDSIKFIQTRLQALDSLQGGGHAN